MSTHKHIDRICAAAVVLSLLLCLLFMNGEALGIQKAENVIGYESRLFDTSRVHTIDIVMDDWDSFIASAESEEYSLCTLVIDGEKVSNVGIRGKGNTSLSTVSSMDSQRYSFKVEFDQYDSALSYYGLDKLSLNNIIQDTTYMKDYLTYRMMAEFGVAAPLCSYAYITVNGEDWGLYLAVEGVEDAFLLRNYGSGYGELYKPDSLSFGGGRGNGRDFSMEDFMNSADADADSSSTGMEMPEGFDFSDMEIPEDFGNMQMPEDFDVSGMFGNMGNMMDAGGMGSSDVMLQYIDDDPDSYSNIFDNAKTDVTSADQSRLISSLKTLSEGSDVSSAVDTEAVLRYFVVHNYVVNGDSYTGSMIHNYYLYEEDGLLSMIPWDYNLAFGTFQGSSASDAVNDPIDTPLSVSGTGRPMIDWIFSDEEYSAAYHELFAEFLESVDPLAIIDEAYALIAPYVQSDPTAFYSYEEFTQGVSALRTFCALRSESVSGQLDGSIPSTDEGQKADSSSLVDAASLTLSDMGSMNMGVGMGDMSIPGNMGDMSSPGETGGMTFPGSDSGSETEMPDMSETPTPNSGTEIPDISGTQPGGQMPGGDGSQMTPPDGMTGEEMTPPGFSNDGTQELPTAPASDSGMPLPDQSAGEGSSDDDSLTQPGEMNGMGNMGGMGDTGDMNGMTGFGGMAQGDMPGLNSGSAVSPIPGSGNADAPASSAQSTGSNLILLAACALILVLAILIAWRWKR